MSLEYTLRVLQLHKPDLADRDKGWKEFVEYEQHLSKKINEYDYLKLTWKSNRQALLFKTIRTGNKELVMRLAPDYLEDEFKNGRLSENTTFIASFVIGMYFMNSNKDKTLELLIRVLENQKPLEGEPMTKDYEKVLSSSMKYFVYFYQIDQLEKYATIWVKCAEELYGKSSLQYLKSKITYLGLLYYRKQMSECYKQSLEVYELARKFHGSETNKDSSEILNLMAKAKSWLKEFDEALNLITKAKENEEKVSSKLSNEYCELDLTEMKIKGEERLYRRTVRRNQTLLSKLTPNTPFKLALFSIGILSVAGIMYASNRK